MRSIIKALAVSLGLFVSMVTTSVAHAADGTEFWFALPRVPSILGDHTTCPDTTSIYGWSPYVGPEVLDRSRVSGYALLVHNDGTVPALLTVRHRAGDPAQGRQPGEYAYLRAFVRCPLGQTCASGLLTTEDGDYGTCCDTNGSCVYTTRALCGGGVFAPGALCVPYGFDACTATCPPPGNVPNGNALVAVPLNGYPIPAGGTVVFDIPRGSDVSDTQFRFPELMMEEQIGTSLRALQATSTTPVSIVLYNRLGYYKPLNDACRVWPVEKLGTEYHFATWGDGTTPTRNDPPTGLTSNQPEDRATGNHMPKAPVRMTVVATRPNTRITVSVPKRRVSRDFPNGEPPRYSHPRPFPGSEAQAVIPLITIDLQPGQAYQYMDERMFDPDGSYSASYVPFERSVQVASNKPVAVFASSDAAHTVDGFPQDFDAMLDQLLPVQHYGVDFLVPNSVNTDGEDPPPGQFRGHGFSDGVTFKIIAANDATEVFIYASDDCPPPDPLPQVLWYPMCRAPDYPPGPQNDLVPTDHPFYSTQLVGAARLNRGDIWEPTYEYCGGYIGLNRYSFCDLSSSPRKPRFLRIRALDPAKPVGVILSCLQPKNHSTCESGEPFQVSLLPVSEMINAASGTPIPFFSSLGLGLSQCPETVVGPGGQSRVVGNPWEHVATIVRLSPPGSYVKLDGAILGSENERWTGWYNFPGGVAGADAQIGWCILHSDRIWEDGEHPELTLRTHMFESFGAPNTDPPPMAVYLFGASAAGGYGYPAWIRPEPPNPITDVVLTDELSRVPGLDVEIAAGSLTRTPTTAVSTPYMRDAAGAGTDDQSRAKSLEWIFARDAFTQPGSMVTLEYDLLLRNLAPGELERIISDDTILAYRQQLSASGPPQLIEQRLGPVSVPIKASSALLTILATPHVVNTPAVVQAQVNFTPPIPHNRASFSSSEDFASILSDSRLGSMLSANDPARPGAVTLDRVDPPIPGNPGSLLSPFQTSGWMSFIADSGTQARWKTLRVRRGQVLKLQPQSDGVLPSNAFEYRIRTGVSRDALVVLSRDPASSQGFTAWTPITSWTNDVFTLASLPLPASQAIEVQVRLNSAASTNTSSQDVAPVLEQLEIDFASASLAIDVTLEDNLDNNIATPGTEVTRLQRRFLSESEVNGGPLSFITSFPSSIAPPGRYVARASFTDLATQRVELTATDGFEITAGLPAVIKPEIDTDRSQYRAGETAVVISTLRNLAVNVPVTDIAVAVTVRAPSGLLVDSYTYRVESLSGSQAIDENRHPLLITSAMSAGTYTVRQEVMVGGSALEPLTANFNVVGADAAGTIRANPPVLAAPSSLNTSLELSATNTGATDLTSVDIRVTVDRVNSSAPPLDLPRTMYSSANRIGRGDTINLSIPFLAASGSTPYGAGPYVATLAVRSPQLPTGWVTLAAGGFYVQAGSGGVSNPVYTLVNLGVLDTDTESRANFINERGEIAGSSRSASGDRAVVWHCGEVSLVTGATVPSIAYGINDQGRVTGIMSPTLGGSVRQRAFAWSPGASSPTLVHTSTDALSSVGFAINSLSDRSQLVGEYRSTATSAARAFAWPPLGATSGNPVVINLSGMISSSLLAVNDHGDAVGWWKNSSNQERALLVRGGTPVDLGAFRLIDSTTSRTFNLTRLTAINDFGDAVGYATDSGTTVPIMSRGNAITVLSTAAAPSGGNVQVFATGINNKGTIVGYYIENSVHKACAWIGGVMYRMTDLVICSPPAGWVLSEATAVNDRQQIVGFANVNGTSATRAFLLELAPMSRERFQDNLKLWVRSDYGVDTVQDGADRKVTQWRDQSCQEKNLIPTASATSKYPTLRTSAGSCCESPRVDFDGVDDDLGVDLAASAAQAIGSSSQPGAPDEATIFLVVQTPSVAARTFLSTTETACGTSTSWFTIGTDTQQLAMSYPHNSQIESVGTDPAQSGVVVYSFRRDKIAQGLINNLATMTVFRNGRIVDFQSFPEAQGAFDFVRLASKCVGSTSTYSQLQVCELLVLNRSLPDSERSRIEQYLSLKYGVGSDQQADSPAFWVHSGAGVEPNRVNGSNIDRWIDQTPSAQVLGPVDNARRPIYAATALGCDPAIEFAPTTGSGQLADFLRVAQVPTDVRVFLILDKSGSMADPIPGGSTRLQAVKDAAVLFAEGLLGESGAHHEVGVISFDSSAGVIRELTTDINLVRTAITGISANGGTNYNGALNTTTNAFNLVPNPQNPDPKREIAIFLTDGVPDDLQGNGSGRTDTIMSNVAALRAAGVQLYTVGVGTTVTSSSSGRALLEGMAAIGSGSFALGTSTSELNNTLASMRRTITAGYADATVAMVFQLTTPVSGDSVRQVLFATGDALAGYNVYAERSGSTTNLVVYAWGQGWTRTFTAPVSNAQPHALELTIETGTLDRAMRAHLDGIPMASTGEVLGRADLTVPGLRIGGMLNDGSVGNQTSFSGGGSFANEYLRGDIAELLIFDASIQPSTRAALRLRFADQYGINRLRNQPPIANAGPDYDILDSGWNGSETLTLSGTGVDPDGTLTSTSYEWYINGARVHVGQSMSYTFPVGVHRVVLQVTDQAGAVDLDEAVISIRAIPGELGTHLRLDSTPDPTQAVNEVKEAGNAVVVKATDTEQHIGRDANALMLSSDALLLLEKAAPNGWLPSGAAPRTISAWVAGNTTLFAQGDGKLGYDGDNFQIDLKDSEVLIKASGDLRGASGLDVFKDWTHVAVVVPDGAEWTDQIQLFINGNRVPIGPMGGPYAPARLSTDYKAASMGAGSEKRFLDDVRIYGRGLSAIEVRNLYESYAFSRWEMNEPSGSTCEDFAYLDTSNGNSAELNGGHYQDPDRGWVVALSNGTKRVMPKKPILGRFDDPTRFTALGWFYTTASPQDVAPIFSAVEPVEELWIGVKDEAIFSNIAGDPIEVAADVAPLTWHFVALTVDQTKYSIYLDGKELVTGNCDAVNRVDHRVIFGGSTSGGSFAGRLHAFRVFPGALDKERVEDIYSREK